MKDLLYSVTGRICVVLFLDVLAFAVIIPVLPAMILSMTNGDASRAAVLQGAAATLDGALKFFMQPFLGRLSDTVGRKPILAYSLIGSTFSFGLYVVSPSVETLFISHALHGLSQCTFLICMSCISDDAHNPDDPSALTHSFGLVGVALGVAFVLGPIVGGALSQQLGFRAVYAISTGLFMLTFWALASFMKETLPLEQRRPFTWKEAIPLRSAVDIYSKSKGLLVLSVAYFLCSLTMGVYGVWIISSTVRYGWHELMAGVLLSLNGVVVVIGQGVFLRALVPRYLSESTTALISYTAHAVLFVLVGLAPTGNMMLVAVVIAGIPSALGEPAIKSVISHAVAKDKQGALQGLMGSVHTMASIGAIMYSELFKYGISEEMRNSNPMPCPSGYTPPPEVADSPNPCGGYPGLPFLVQAGFFFVAVVLMRKGFQMVAAEGEDFHSVAPSIDEESSRLTELHDIQAVNDRVAL